LKIELNITKLWHVLFSFIYGNGHQMMIFSYTILNKVILWYIDVDDITQTQCHEIMLIIFLYSLLAKMMTISKYSVNLVYW